jgi:hypothetical protein
MKNKTARKLRHGTIKAQVNTLYYYKSKMDGRGRYLLPCELVEIRDRKFRIRSLQTNRILPKLRKVGDLLTAGHNIVRIRINK